MRLLLVLLLAFGLTLGAAAEGSRGGKRGGAPRAPRLNPGEEDDENHVDGSKLFTADTETTPDDEFSFAFAYLLSAAHSGFDDNHQQSPLGLDRRNDFYLGALSHGVTDNLDLTLVAGASTATDLYDLNQSPSLVYTHGFGPSFLAAIARWRFWEDEEEGRSLALVGGPALVSQQLLEDVGYRTSSSFLSWNQSLVARQDFAPFSLDLELFDNFPLQNSPVAFTNLGANLAIGWDADEMVLPVAELNYQQLIPSQGPVQESLAVTLGVILKPGDDIAFNLGVQKALTGRNIENFTTYLMGGSVNF